MEVNFTLKYEEMISRLKALVEKIRLENEPDIRFLMKEYNLGKTVVTDAVYHNLRQSRYNIRVVLLNTDNLVMNISNVLKTLIIPYQLKIDIGYNCLTLNNDYFNFFPSRNSSLDLEQWIIRHKNDLSFFMQEIGWDFTTDKFYKRSDNVIIEQAIGKHDDIFGLHTTSKMSFQFIYSIELYIECDRDLLLKWTRDD